ncbi:MAG: hypothetical protein Q9223_004344 [Gallowayella weberi]
MPSSKIPRSLSLLLISFFVLLQHTVAAPDQKYFTIDYFESALSYSGGPKGPQRQVNITDTFNLRVNNDTDSSSTTCESFYPVASPPSSIATGAGCNDISFTWWFVEYKSATDFGIAVNHRYARAPG